jgi:DNA-binding SARP family transcriptional activator
VPAVAPTVAAAATARLPSGYRAAVLEFRILGPLEVVGSAGEVQLGGPKQRATLAILLLNANRVVSIDALADQLYAGRPPVTAATQVHRQISELRKTLGEDAGIETRSPGYAIRVAPEQFDLKQFERLTQEAAGALARGETRAALEVQQRALALWRGPPLADLTDEPFAATAVRRLEEILLAALEQRMDAELALGRHRELVGELGQLVSQHPSNEPFASRLMLALYRSGRQADALDVYRRTRERLVGDFGIEPGRALRELERAVLNQDASLDINESPRPAVQAPDQIVLVLP